MFRPAEFEFHRKEKNYHHTMHDTRLPPSCMTSMEKLQRFVNEMEKQCALRQTNQNVSISLSNNERLSTTIDDNDSISIANESDLFDSYSADDITEIQHDNSLKVDMTTFREKISNDMRFINERWKMIVKKQGETGTNSKLFRMPNFRYLISNKPKERNSTLAVPNQNTHALIDKINPLSHCTHLQQNHNEVKHVTFANDQKHAKVVSQTSSDDPAMKKEAHVKLGKNTG